MTPHLLTLSESVQNAPVWLQLAYLTILLAGTVAILYLMVATAREWRTPPARPGRGRPTAAAKLGVVSLGLLTFISIALV